MGRIANKKTGKLNKAYRDPSVFYSTSRGRKRNPWKSSSKKRSPRSCSPNWNTVNTTNEVSPKQTKGCLVGLLVFILIIGVVVFAGRSGSKVDEKSDELITLEQLQSQSHPKVADNEEDIKKYYKDIAGVRFEHASDFKSDKTVALTWHYTSVYGDDTLNDIVIDFSKLSVDEQSQLTFEKVLDTAISFVPIEEILEYYAFDRAIYVEREDHIAHELYYKEIDEKVTNRPSKYYQDHGFSIVIKEYKAGYFKVFIETSWYDYEYDIDSFPRSINVTQEELDAHQEWQFSLEKYMSSR